MEEQYSETSMTICRSTRCNIPKVLIHQNKFTFLLCLMLQLALLYFFYNVLLSLFQVSAVCLCAWECRIILRISVIMPNFSQGIYLFRIMHSLYEHTVLWLRYSVFKYHKVSSLERTQLRGIITCSCQSPPLVPSTTDAHNTLPHAQHNIIFILPPAILQVAICRVFSPNN
jgi:hypothetical protein